LAFKLKLFGYIPAQPVVFLRLSNIKSKFPGGTSPGKSFASTECDRKINDSVLFRQQSEIHFEQLRLHRQQQEFPL
ncbi:hypothetical protein, partial [uncultured Victivallis sp.]|uniref:hypothetical protein n=1 Tax=uncultured Victivallis sp. TaxID=354118 RepID=UPI0025FFFB4B